MYAESVVVAGGGNKKRPVFRGLDYAFHHSPLHPGESVSTLRSVVGGRIVVIVVVVVLREGRVER